MTKLIGRKPVLDALEAEEPIDKIFIQSGAQGNVIRRIYRLARQQQIPIVQADRQKMEKLSAAGKHQGVVALLPPVEYVALEELVSKIKKQSEPANMLILDRIQDPHNMGAILRSAEIFGVQGVVFSSRENVPITEVVVKASAGAVFHLPLCRVGNLAAAVRYLKEAGIWVYASSSHGSRDIREMDFTRPHAVLIGSEGKGVRPLLLKESDEHFAIPQQGKTESLNVSVAAGIILWEVFRQRSERG